jgi:hypothetical protein
VVPRANHQENKRSRVNKSEFVPQNEGNNCMICKNWSLALRCKVKLKRKSKNIVIRKKKQLCNGIAGNKSNNFPLDIGKDQSVLLPSVVDLGQ